MSFSNFHFSPEISRAIKEQGFQAPTPVQQHVIPEAMKGRDIHACAQTGTGKTCAFALPLLDKLHQRPSLHHPRALILVPTRELGTQVHSVIKEIGRHTKVRSTLIMGGSNLQKQVRGLRAGADIVVATPGRLLDHLQRRTFSLKYIQNLVMDEGDRMLDMGFLPDINRILSFCPPRKQSMIFSATFPPEIERLISRVLRNPFVVDLAPSQPAVNITHVLYPVNRGQKEIFLKSLMEKKHMASALIFCRTKQGSNLLYAFLKREGQKVAIIHSGFNQRERQRALENFKNRAVQFLVATNVASRGLDIQDITHVINFDVPQYPEDYVHRIGRTGRADALGDAFTLVAFDEEPFIRRIEKMIGKDIPRKRLEGFPYLVPPRLEPKPKSISQSFGRIRRRFSSSRRRFG